jgi:hypothetical protein
MSETVLSEKPETPKPVVFGFRRDDLLAFALLIDDCSRLHVPFASYLYKVKSEANLYELCGYLITKVNEQRAKERTRNKIK